ncbi:MAG: transporter substrate-binding domain-containing protein [Gammaproteobacteria bacterium]
MTRAVRVGWAKTVAGLGLLLGGSAMAIADTGNPLSTLTAEERRWIADNPTVRFTGDPAWLPIEAFTEDGQYVGVVSDLLDQISARTGLEFETLHPASWSAALELVASKQVDMISGTTANAVIDQTFDATRPYLTTNVVMVMRAGSPPVNHLLQLEDRRVGVMRDYAYVPLLEESYPTLSFEIVESVRAGLQAVREGNLDALLATNVTARYNILNQDFSDLAVVGNTSVFLSATLFTAKDKPLLASIVDKALLDISFETRNQIFDRWMKPDDGEALAVTPLTLLPEQRAWLDANSPFDVAGDPDWLPYEAFDSNGNYIGMVAEHLRLVEQLLGVEFNVVRTVSWSDSVALARRGDIDVLSETNDSDLTSQLAFSDAYLSSPIVMVAMRDTDFVPDLQSVANRPIGVVSEYGYVPSIRRVFSDTEFVEYPTLREGLLDVATGRIDVMLCSLAQCSYQIPRESLNNLRIVGRTSFTTHLAFGVQDDKKALVPLINAALDAINPLQRQRILTSWARDPLLSPQSNRWLYWLLALALTAALFGAFRSMQLVAKVRARSAQARRYAAQKREAERANLAKSRFLASMSHEVRTPMNGVLGLIEILSHTALDRRQSQTVGVIRQSAQSLMTIIDDLLDLSRIESGDLRISDEVTRIGNLVESVVSTHAISAQKKGLRVRLYIDPDLNRSIMLDPVRVRQILSNFLSNAIKFTERGAVTIRATRVDDQGDTLRFRLEVEDTGIGIEAHHQEKLFERFSQADDTTALRFGGTGLGLSICRELAALMDGSIELESEIDRGTQIRYTQTAAYAAQNDERKVGIADVTALVLINNPFDRNTVSRYLSALELTCINDMPLPSSLADARTVLKQSAANLVVMDTATLRSVQDAGPATLDCPLVVLDTEAVNGNSDYRRGHCTVSGNPLLPSAFGLAVRVSLGESMLEPASRDTVFPLVDARILIVEDHPINQSVLRIQLDLLGYQCHVVNNGKEGLSAWREGRFDAILTDCAMPVMDGYVMTEMIREEQGTRGSPIPILGLTASSMPGEAYRCREAGMDDCLFKPVELAQIDSSLGHWLGLRGKQVAAEPDSPTPLPVIDRAHLTLMFQKDDVIERVLREFINSSRDDLAIARRGALAGDAQIVRQKAHYVAGAATTVKASEVAQLGREISQAPPDIEQDKLAALVERMGDALEAFARAAGDDERSANS